MKTIFLSTLLIVLASFSSYASYSMLNCTAETGTTIQVYLNGKQINKKPTSFVRVKSKDGCNSISVIIYTSAQNQPARAQRDIEIEPGYEVFFSVTSDECGPKLTISRRYPLLNTYSYSKKLYARQFIS